eukprot:768236-Hanusia_phi.AAC.2
MAELKAKTSMPPPTADSCPPGSLSCFRAVKLEKDVKVKDEKEGKVKGEDRAERKGEGAAVCT